MSSQDGNAATASPLLGLLRRKNVLAGLFFIGVAVFGLWLSRNYSIGTATRMGTGYVPRLLLWLLLVLGGGVLVQGLRAAREDMFPQPGGILRFWPLVAVTLAMVAFGLALERLGLVIAVALLLGIGSLAERNLRLWETVAATVLLILLSWLIFILGLGLAIPLWPVW
ncbi:MAG: Tripartite tricarboxylate transporter TctB family [Xanthobacteraceae bacterium]|jgi:hypothetical protein|nr:Tripartite tricarboxylate transporter TctB family [Xanthobacteraceae bacterium]